MTEEYGIARGRNFSLESMTPTVQRIWLVEAASTSRRWQLMHVPLEYQPEFFTVAQERFPSLVKEGKMIRS
jgi:hypothetical protein